MSHVSIPVNPPPPFYEVAYPPARHTSFDRVYLSKIRVDEGIGKAVEKLSRILGNGEFACARKGGKHPSGMIPLGAKNLNWLDAAVVVVR